MTGFGNNKAKTILDLFTYDLSTFFLTDDYVEVRSEDEQGTIMIDYEKALPWTEAGLFDTVIYRMFSDKLNIVGSNHINATLLSRHVPSTPENVSCLIQKLFDMLGNDDHNQGIWDPASQIPDTGQLVERYWTLGKDKDIYSVKLIFNSDHQVSLTIFFLNRLLKIAGKA